MYIYIFFKIKLKIIKEKILWSNIYIYIVFFVVEELNDLGLITF